jgi:hypothetical protein
VSALPVVVVSPLVSGAKRGEEDLGSEMEDVDVLVMMPHPMWNVRGKNHAPMHHLKLSVCHSFSSSMLRVHALHHKPLMAIACMRRVCALWLIVSFPESWYFFSCPSVVCQWLPLTVLLLSQCRYDIIETRFQVPMSPKGSTLITSTTVPLYSMPIFRIMTLLAKGL